MESDNKFVICEPQTTELMRVTEILEARLIASKKVDTVISLPCIVFQNKETKQETLSNVSAFALFFLFFFCYSFS